MRRIVLALALIPALFTAPVFAGDAEVKAAQTTIDSQLKAFSADDGNTAYSYAAPNVKQIFPTLDAFMSMVTNGYAPVRKPQSYAFGKAQEMSATTIAQQVSSSGPTARTTRRSTRSNCSRTACTASPASACGPPSR